MRKILQYLLTQIKMTTFIKNTGLTFTTKLLVALLNMILVILTARFLGPEGRGEFSATIALCALAVYIALLGLNAANTHFVARDRSHLPQFISNNIFFSGFIGVFLMIFIYFIQNRFADFSILHSKVLYGLAFLWIFFNLNNVLNQGLFSGINDFKTFNKIEAAAPLTGLLGIVTFIGLNRVSIENLFLCLVIGQLTSFIISLVCLNSFTKNPLMFFSWPILKQNLLYGIRLLYFPSVFLLVLLNADLLLIKFLLGAEEAGYYSVAVAVANIFLLFPGVTSIVLFAKLSAIADRKESWQHTCRVLKWLTLPLLFALLLCAIVANPLMNWLFGEKFNPSTTVFINLLPAIFCNAIATIYLNYFAAMGMGKINIYSTALACLINIALNLSFIPIYGIIGSTYAANITYVGLLTVLVLYNLFKQHNDTKAYVK